MKLTESNLRSIIREELMKEMHQEPESMSKASAMVAGGLAGGAMFGTPFAIAAFLQNHPEMMQAVQELLKSLMQE
jgi:hypothetical protein